MSSGCHTEQRDFCNDCPFILVASRDEREKQVAADIRAMTEDDCHPFGGECHKHKGRGVKCRGVALVERKRARREGAVVTESRSVKLLNV